MQKIEAFAQAAGLLGAQLRRGVVTNSFLTAADCDREAKTIHRLLESGYRNGEGKAVFARNQMNPLECDVVILDEVSMIDIVLMQALLEAMPPETRLILVGDADQLPPVGPGNFLRDCISSERIHTVELDEIFRQAPEKCRSAAGAMGISLLCASTARRTSCRRSWICAANVCRITMDFLPSRFKC